MGASKEVPQVNEFAMALVFHVNKAPAVLPATDLLAIDQDVLLTADHSEWDDVLHMGYGGTNAKEEEVHTLICAFVARSSSSSSSLSYGYIFKLWKLNSSLILSLKACRSSRVSESALAITGTTLTTSDNFFRTTMSIGLRLQESGGQHDIDFDCWGGAQYGNAHAWPDGWMKNKQQWMRVSWI